MENQVVQLSECPRCEELGYERLRTYAHCVNCNYFDDYSNQNTSALDEIFLPDTGFRVRRKKAMKTGRGIM